MHSLPLAEGPAKMTGKRHTWVAADLDERAAARGHRRILNSDTPASVEMSAPGTKQTFSRSRREVWFRPKSGHT